MVSVVRISIVAFLLIVICFPRFSYAKERQYHLGINYTKVDAAGLSQVPGFVLGWGTVPKPEKNYYLHTAFNLVVRHTTLLNQIASSYPGYISRLDFRIDLVYFQIPFLFKMRLPKMKPNTRFFLGPSVLFCMYDHVDSHYLATIYNPDYDDVNYNGRVDVRFNEDPGIVKSILDSSSLEFICGFDYNMGRLTTGLFYSISMLRQPEAIMFNKRLHTVTLITRLK